MYQSSFLSFHFITQSLPLYSPESAPGLLGTLARWEREVFLCPIFWTGYKFLGSKHNHLTVLFSAHLSPAFLSTCIPTDDRAPDTHRQCKSANQISDLKRPSDFHLLLSLHLHTFANKEISILPGGPVYSLLLYTLSASCQTTQCLHLLSMCWRSWNFKLLPRYLHRASASYLQPPVGHFHSNISQKIEIQHIINSTQHPSSLIRSG